MKFKTTKMNINTVNQKDKYLKFGHSLKEDLYIIILIFFIAQYSYSQDNFNYKKTPYSLDFRGSLNMLKYYCKSITLEKYLPKGYVKDGSIEYTKFIQKCLDENAIILLPNFPLLVSKNGIIARSNSTLIFQKRSSFNMSPNSLQEYGILKIINVDNVKIYSPSILGDREKHLDDKGEWGMGIYILSSRNVDIINPNIKDCWGDGIYIGSDNNNGTSNHIRIVNAQIDNCRRNGISITDGNHIDIVNAKISNTNGTAPMSGIDIEPNNNDAVIDSIFLINPLTYNNSRYGILISLNHFIGEQNRIVGVKIENHKDNGSDIGFEIFGYNKQDSKLHTLCGLINITNPIWINNRLPILINNTDFGPKVVFENIENKKQVLIDINRYLPSMKNVYIK